MPSSARRVYTNTMRLTLTEFLTLDGVAQGPGSPEEDTSDGFTQGGWFVPYLDKDFIQRAARWLAEADALLFGRRTYVNFARDWPRITDPDDPFSEKMNGLPKYVASTTLKTAEWHNTTVIRGDVVEAVRALKRAGTGELQVHGSPGLAQTLIANDLVDEYRLWVHPVVLGSGKRLFGAGTVAAALRLSATSTTSTGVVVHTYERADALRYGEFSVDEETSTQRLLKGEFRSV